MESPLVELEKRKRKRKGMEFQLPEPIIQHIQSFMSPRDAARTTVLSKWWRAAWLTQPTLEFNHISRSLWRPSCPFEFVESVMATLKRYAESNLIIDSFIFQIDMTPRALLGLRQVPQNLNNLAQNLENLVSAAVAAAMKIGPTHLDLYFCSLCPVAMPEEVLQSDTLVRLSLSDCAIDVRVKWPKLKSLKLRSVSFKNGDDAIKNLVSSCVSIEDFSLSDSRDLKLSRENLCGHHKLRGFFLKNEAVDDSFFEDFGSRFPCLKELSLDQCHGFSKIRISSASLQRLSISVLNAFEFHLNLPNLAYLSYKSKYYFNFNRRDIPSVTMEEAENPKEWESHIHIIHYPIHYSPSWYPDLKRLLKQLGKSRINLSIVDSGWRQMTSEDVVNDGGEAVVVESLNIILSHGWGHSNLFNLFSMCRPKFVALHWPIQVLGYKYEELMQEVRKQSVLWGFDIQGEKVEVYQDFYKNLRLELCKNSLDSAPSDIREVRFELKWK